MKANIETEIIIEASLAEVMGVLKDTTSHSHWNPFIREIKGSFKAGEIIQILITPPGGSTMKFKPRVLEANDYEIRWLGKFLMKGIFDGEHYFVLKELSLNKTKLIHGEKFSGLLVPLFKGVLDKTKLGFIQMNEALKNEFAKKNQLS